MSVDVGKIKRGDTVRLEVSVADTTLTGVVNEFAGELGVWFAGSWFALSRWGGMGITLISSAEPEQTEWADALVIKPLRYDVTLGGYEEENGGRVWISLGEDGGHVWTLMPDEPVAVVIDKDGRNVEAGVARDAANSRLATAATRLQAIRHILDGDDE